MDVCDDSEHDLSYSNPNYHLNGSDENCNVDYDDDFDDIYDGIDVSCRVNRNRLNTRGRHKYASLDPTSMGVDVDEEKVPMLAPNSENNLNQSSIARLSADQADFDNGSALFDANQNTSISKEVNFANFYSDSKPVKEKEKNVSFQTTEPATEKSPSLDKADNPAGSSSTNTSDSSPCESLPAGWEKHEDDSGPYYWHISSGTIQRDPPLSQTNFDAISSRFSKDLDFISSDEELFMKQAHNVLSSKGLINSGLNHLSDSKMKRKSCPAGSYNEKRPIRFSVRSLGWVEIDEEDLTPERSSKAVNKCIIDLSVGRNDILDVVGRWGEGKDLFMDLDDYSLRLMDTQDFTVLNTQPIHTIRVWGVGRDNGRDFAYVARDRTTKKYMCHVFRCDIPARIIANTLRDICKKISIERNMQKSRKKEDSEKNIPKKETKTQKITPTRPNDLPMERGMMQQSISHESFASHLFPTPMEEPKKVLKAFYLGSINVDKATGVDVLHNAIEKVSATIQRQEYKFVNVAIAPSTITVSDIDDEENVIVECRVRFLSFLGIGKNVKHCGFIVHTAKDEFVAHIFYCEPSSGALCKTIEAACKLRYQKCLDAHRHNSDEKATETQKKGLRTALKGVFGTLFNSRHRRSTET